MNLKLLLQEYLLKAKVKILFKMIIIFIGFLRCYIIQSILGSKEW